MRQFVLACLAATFIVAGPCEIALGQMALRSGANPSRPAPASNGASNKGALAGWYYYQYQWEVRWGGSAGGSFGFAPSLPYSPVPRRTATRPPYSYDYNDDY